MTPVASDIILKGCTISSSPQTRMNPYANRAPSNDVADMQVERSGILHASSYSSTLPARLSMQSPSSDQLKPRINTIFPVFLIE